MAKNKGEVLRILLVGPENAGKTTMANYLADLSVALPEEFKHTQPLRIVEFEIKGQSDRPLDVQLWDCSGDEKNMIYWSATRKHADGIVFVYNDGDANSAKKLDVLYNFYVGQDEKISPRQCLVARISSSDRFDNIKLPPVFSKISQVSVNLDERSVDKFRAEFGKYVNNLIKSVSS